MQDEVLVSVYCLAYNHEKYIRDTLEGFVNQVTDFKYEVIVHDDASTDDTASVIRKYAKKYPHIIKPIYQVENQYSKQIRIVKTFVEPLMKGKYIAVCEGDDCWTDNNKLQMQVDILENNANYSACVHQTVKHDCRTNKKMNISQLKADGILDKDIVFLGGSKAYHTSSLVYRREYFFKQPEFCSAIRGVGDYPLSIYLALCGDIYYINRAMSLYRLSSGETSWVNRNSSLDKQHELTDSIIKMLKMADEYSEYKYKELFNSAISYNKYKLKILEISPDVIINKESVNWFKKERKLFQLKYIVKLCLPEKLIHKIKSVKSRKEMHGR